MSSRCALLALLLTVACAPPLEVRVVNTSDQDFDSVVIHGVVGLDHFVDVDYGPVPAGGATDYIEWESLQEESPTTVVFGDETLEFRAFDPIGRDHLTSGRYRHVVTIVGVQLRVATQPDD